jgi:muramoyltetrapeptide carboxypeptidase
VVEAPNLRKAFRYTAGTVSERCADLTWALTSPDVDAVWAVRGGSGSARLLDALPWGDVVAHRPLLGFSDTTALFAGCWRQGRGRPVHAPVLHSLTDHADQGSREALRVRLQEGRTQLDGAWLRPPVQPVSGPLVGGNLCVLASLCGTPWQLDARGCVLLLEDIGEPPYKLDRLIWQMKSAGAFDGVRAVLLGEFTGSTPHIAPGRTPWTLHEQLSDLLAPLGCPVLAGVPVGHGATNHTFAWGDTAELSAAGVRIG